MDSIADLHQRTNRFVELNVIEQVYDLAKTSIVQNAWDNDQDLAIHGWVYAVENGIIKDLGVNFKNDSQLDEVYKLDF